MVMGEREMRELQMSVMETKAQVPRAQGNEACGGQVVVTAGT